MFIYLRYIIIKKKIETTSKKQTWTQYKYYLKYQIYN